VAVYRGNVQRYPPGQRALARLQTARLTSPRRQRGACDGPAEREGQRPQPQDVLQCCEVLGGALGTLPARQEGNPSQCGGHPVESAHGGLGHLRGGRLGGRVGARQDHADPEHDAREAHAIVVQVAHYFEQDQ
jgi:hypothetical protein